MHTVVGRARQCKGENKADLFIRVQNFLGKSSVLNQEECKIASCFLPFPVFPCQAPLFLSLWDWYTCVTFLIHSLLVPWVGFTSGRSKFVFRFWQLCKYNFITIFATQEIGFITSIIVANETFSQKVPLGVCLSLCTYKCVLFCVQRGG